ncbi:interleukin-23 receptor isoform X2 [Pseudoliparis swirei]|uniref:interleukin-23 receptor isoform X2 n=1 Tax=Pseudoliparis swirei TaxID=2059687 RepID=UPI0024BE3FF3|nr:interleukin-23 receptor isoform X2 [Pseudoliparis swirei]
MNLPSTLWRFITILLGFPFKRGPLLPAGCQPFIASGYLTVEPGPLFLIGSNLTVYCCIPTLQGSSSISLQLNDEMLTPSEKFNSTTAMFHLVNVQKPRSFVRCKLEPLSKVVTGLDLRGGLPPDKPVNVRCETSRTSDFITCTWERGRETHLLPTYNVSLYRENGTRMLIDRIQGAENVSIRRAEIDENTTHRMVITAYNHFAASRSDPFMLRVKDIMMPEIPRIVQIEFGNNFSAALLHWETAGSSESLRSSEGLRSSEILGSSESLRSSEGLQSSESLRSDVRLRNLESLRSSEGLRSDVRLRSSESLRSNIRLQSSEGLRSSESLRSDVRLRADKRSWEAGAATELSEGLIRVSGLKPLTHYEFQMRTCRGERSPCSTWSPSVGGRSPGKGPSQQMDVWRAFGGPGTAGLRMVMVLWKVPTELRALSVSAVTLYGTSPSADVPLGRSGDDGPVLRVSAPSANGSSVFASWSGGEPLPSTSGGEPLHYVLEWTGVPGAELQWQKVALDQNCTFIRGLTAGVRYNISLYAVTARGVSAPSSVLVYSKEQKPASGPNMSVLVHKSRRILIQWDELPVARQKGFITNYTVYLQTLDGSSTELRLSVPGSAPRRMWLDCPEGAVALQLTASTSAGEGRRGGRVCSQHKSSGVGPGVVMVSIIALFIAIVANLMCWSCVRQRVKQKCVSWGPAWLHENLPKLGNSTAIRLLERDGSEPFLSSADGDPPLSSISLVSREDVVYSAVPVQSETPSPPPPTNGYRPQAAAAWKEAEDERRDAEEEDRCAFGDFLTGLQVDFSDPAPGPTLGSAGGLPWRETLETTVFSNGDFLLGRKGPENGVEEDSQRGETMTPDSTCFPQFTVEMLTGGYFPQAAAVSGTNTA